MSKRTPWRHGRALTAALLAGSALAQTAPDAGSVLRGSQQAPAVPPTLVRPAPPPSRPTEETGPKLLVRAFVVEGSTRFGDDEWRALLADLVGERLGMAGLQAAADRVALRYRQAGLHALAFLPEQDLAAGVVRVAVVEGRFGALRLEPLVHVPQRLLEQMLARGQAPGEILNIDALESATLVANDLPGLKVSSVLAAGRQAGQTDILVKVEPTALLTGNASADNLDPRSTGETKLTTNLGLNNAFGVGDQLTLTAQATTGKAYTNLSGSLPLAAGGQRIALNASTLQYRLQGSFAATGAHGSSDVAGANLSWPLLRSQTTNVQAQLAYSHAHLRSDADAGNLSDKSEQSLTLGLNLNRSDEWGGGGVTLAGWSLVGGALDLSANPDSLAQDRAGAGTQGRFYKLTWNAARLQQLPAGAQLWLSASGQAAFNNLDSGQKFSLGGASGVRAYPALEASGDDGTQLTVEVRRALRAGWMGKLFYDWGNVLQSHDGRGAAASVPNRYALQGWGVGLDWSPMARVSLRAVLAQRIGSNPAAQPGTGHDSDGTLHTVQTWLTANVDF